jgi:hypothetical protein
MTDEHNTEAKQRLLDRQMETAVWPDEYLEKTAFANKPNLSGLLRNGSGASGKTASDKPSGTFAEIGGKCVLQPTAQPRGKKTGKKISLEHLGGRCILPAPESDAFEESKDHEVIRE